MKKILHYTCLLALLTLTMFSCKDDDDHDHSSDHYVVDIMIMSPTDNMTAAASSEAHIHINFSNTGEDPTIHNVKVELLDANDAVVETLTDEHIHDGDGIYEFHDMMYILPNEIGTYTLRASSTNMAGEGDNVASHTIVVQ